MAARSDVSAVAVGTAAAGAVLIWSGLRGASILTTLTELIRGQHPTGANAHPIDAQVSPVAGVDAGGMIPASAGSVAGVAAQVAQTPAGRANYCWGGGHTSSPCSARCFDCSGYVSCVLNRMGVMKGSMTTTGFLTWSGATTIPYAQRQAGDLYVSASHIGIIVDSTHFLNAACTACGAVKLSNYVGRSGYVVRRVKGT